MIEREYYPNGQIKFETPYDHQEQQYGTEKSWYSDGQPCHEVQFHHGQLHGIEKSWHANGELNYEIYWLYNKEVNQEEYREYELITILSGL